MSDNGNRLRFDVALTGLPLDMDSINEGRALIVKRFLWTLIERANDQTDPVTWQQSGGLEVREFLDCLEDGRDHPLLAMWRDQRAWRGNPAPGGRERAARRMAALMAASLERSGKSRSAARMTAASALNNSRLFHGIGYKDQVTKTKIRHWQQIELSADCWEQAGLLALRLQNNERAIINHWLGLRRWSIPRMAAGSSPWRKAT